MTTAGGLPRPDGERSAETSRPTAPGPRKPVTVRVPGCLTAHREDLLYGLHLAKFSSAWTVGEQYPVSTVTARKLSLSREESRALDEAVRMFGITQKDAIVAALHHARRSRLSRTFTTDCRAGGCAVENCPVAFNAAVEAAALDTLGARRAKEAIAQEPPSAAGSPDSAHPVP